MTISFNDVPSDLLIPFTAIEFDNTEANQGPSILAYRTLIIAQKTSAGTATANVPIQISNVSQALTLGGRGSMAHRMCAKYFVANKSTETWLLPVADNGAGVAAHATLTFSGPATADGTLNFYFGGVYVPVAVASGDDDATMAASTQAAIAANLDLAVTATVSTNVVTVTYRHKGTVGNAFDMRLNYQTGDSTPAGASVVIGTMASGATDPVLTTAIANLADKWFHIWIHPYTGATPLSAIEAELLDRSGPMRQIQGSAITSATGSNSTLETLSQTRNSEFSSIVAQPGQNPVTPPAEFAAAVGGVIAKYASIDPGQPLQTLTIPGVLPPADVDLFTNEERNVGLGLGLASTKVTDGGLVRIERIVTTYRTNGVGAADVSYRDLNTMLTLMYLRYSFGAMIGTSYPRCKLANDGSRFGAGQAVVTPKLIKAAAVGWFDQMEKLGLVEDAAQFKADLVVERDESDVNRVNILLPPNLINQLVVTAAKVQFRL